MLLDELKSIVGDKGWSDDPYTLEPHLTEWRGRYRGRTPLMVMPDSTKQVADVVRLCAQHETAIVPQGGNTGLCGGAIPDESGEQVLMSLSRLRQIRAVDPDDFSLVAEAGCVLTDVQAAASSAGRFFPLSLSAEGSCQIGGLLSTDAGGINVLRYGTARQQVLGLEVVLADGTVWDGLRSLRKDTAGYDMKQLFLGSEGTLGVITAATLKLYPHPGQATTVLVALSSAQDAVRLLARLREALGDRIQAFELMSDRCLRFVARHIPDAGSPWNDEHPWYALCDVVAGNAAAGIEKMLAATMETGLVSDGIIAKNQSEAEQLWRIRHSVSEAQKSEGASLKHDISVPVACIGEFLRRGDGLLQSLAPDARLVAFGHVGDGNLHYNVSQPVGANPEEFRSNGAAITDAIYELVTEYGGSISAEHGIGLAKKDALRRYRPETEIRLMETLKKALDPANILNPGKVI